jgi:hypothetical protein
VALYQSNSIGIERLRDHRKTDLIAHSGQDLESFLPESLEGIGRGAGFKGTAAKECGAG